MAGYDSYKAEAAFDFTELRIAYDNYSIILGGSAVDAGVDVKYQSGTLQSTSIGSPFTIDFTFKKDGAGNWLIRTMSVGGTTWQ